MSNQYKQHSIFQDSSHEQPKNPAECEAAQPKVFKLYIDGAARKNPGPAGVGICIKLDDEVVVEQGFFVGTRTNNQAEYLGLLVGIFFMHNYVKKHDFFLIYSDSQLLVCQMTGVYKIRDPLLQKMHDVAHVLLQHYSFKFCHVYREHNVQADKMANRGIDKKVALPKKFVDMMQPYDVL